MAPKRTVDPKFVRPGRGRDAKPVILYAGLLDTAHDAGLQSITTELLHLDLQNRTAVCRATVTMLEDGVARVYQGIGDASPENSGPIAKDAWIRMAETRAKSRALRDAINVGDSEIEGDVEDDGPPARPAPRPAPAPVRPSAPAPTPAPTQAGSDEPARPRLLHNPDDVEHFDDDQLVEACSLMAERLAQAGVATGPMPDPRTRRSMRTWYRTGYTSLTARTAPAVPETPQRRSG